MKEKDDILTYLTFLFPLFSEMISLNVVAVETNAGVELYLVILKEDDKTKFSGLYLRSPKEVKLHTKEAKTMDRLKKGHSKQWIEYMISQTT